MRSLHAGRNTSGVAHRCARRPSGRTHTLLAPMLLSLLVGCTITPDQWGPLWSHGLGPSPGSRETHVLWPLFRWRTGPDERSFAVRPLWERRWFPDGSTRTEFLWPFGLATSDARGTRRQLLPLYWWKTTYADDVTGGFLAPLFFHSRRGEDPANVFVVPLWGRWRNLLAIESVRFLFFPLWMRTETVTRTGETTTTHLLWPIFHVHSGERTGAAIWPLWGLVRGPGEARSTFVLWPFWQTRHDPGIDLEEHFVFPFWGHSRSRSGEATTILWPFVSWSQGPWGEAVDVWPVYKRHERGAVHRFRVFPFYLTTRTPEIESETWLWPIVWKRHETTPGFERDSRYVLPFFWSFDTRRQGEDPERAVRWWPFVHTIEGSSGLRRLVVLAPLPWSPSRADENPWDFLWVILRGWSWDRAPDEGGRSWFLEGPARLFLVERDARGTYLQLPLVRIRLGGGEPPVEEGES